MNFDLQQHTILLTIAGSRAYGLHTEASDVDLKGVAIPPKPYFLGFLQSFEQADDAKLLAPFEALLEPEEKAAATKEKLEGSVYNLIKFVKLAADCNPNILDALFCRDEEVRLATRHGERLREHRDAFLSAKAKHTFSGYAAAQLKKIRGHRKWLLDPPKAAPTRAEFDLPETTLIPADQIAAAEAAVRKQLDTWEIDFGDLADSEKVHIQAQIVAAQSELASALGMGIEDAKWLASARLVGLDDNLIAVLQREREYGAAKRRWTQYSGWKKNRDPGRAALEAKYGYDTKHGAHLVRLLRMGREILETGTVNVWREDRDELLAIRRGAWDYERLVQWAEAEDAALTELYRRGETALPKAPDRAALDRLTIELVEDALSTNHEK